MNNSERRNLLEQKMKELNKGKKDKDLLKFGSSKEDPKYISYGIEEIDKFTGGGATQGTFTVIYGGKSVGKTTLALQQIASAQQKNLICCLIDLERGWDKDRAIKFGVNLDDLVLVESAKSAEDAMDIINELSKDKLVDLVIIDSINAMSPESEQQTKKGKSKSIADDSMALLARKLGQFFRMVAPHIFRAKIAVVLIGQVRTHGIGSFFTYAGLSGGKALEHWMQTCLFIRTGQKADAPVEKKKVEIETPDGVMHKKTVKDIVGFDAVIKMEKTKNSDSASEGKDIHIPFYFKTGFLPPVVEVIEDPDVPSEDIVAPEFDKVTEGGDPKECIKEEKPKKKCGRPKKEKS